MNQVEKEAESNQAPEYLFAAFMEADWIDEKYKSFGEKFRKEPKIIRELYLCACDGVDINMLHMAETKEPIENSFRGCRKRHLEERFLAGYTDDLNALKVISNAMVSEVKKVSQKVTHIAEHIPSMEEMFTQTEPPKESVNEQQEKIINKVPVADRIEVSVKHEKPSFMSNFREGFFRLKRPAKYVEKLVSEGYSEEQIAFILDCLESGDKIKDIEAFASPKITVELMKKLRDVQKGELNNG